MLKSCLINSPLMNRLFAIAVLSLLFAGGIAHSQTVWAQEESTANDDILFLSDQSGEWDTYLINPDGTDLRWVTGKLRVHGYESVFSPDKTQIALISSGDDGETLWLVESSGRRVIRPLG